jgi:predicted CoA-binding protein
MTQDLALPDREIADILRKTKVIALVGWSPKPERPSNSVARFLKARGYRVIPVNPGLAGQMSDLGELVRGSLAEIGEAVDMIDIFRRSDAAGAVVDEALQAFPDLRAIWMQLDVIEHAAALRARERGVAVVMDRCPAIEIPRLGL